ncbi:MAG: hypothetical protein M3N19_05275, partial [Candidatus Eremiobacteraeota bacterium]|nr:hypothetical protein [Candidatus Eremiobacteraeota bacterium]
PLKLIRTFLIPVSMVAALALPVASMAQSAPADPPAAAGQMHHGHHNGFMRAMKNLNLTDDQKTKMKALMMAFHQAHPQGSPRDPEAMKTLHDQMMALLTPAQQAQFKTNVAAMPAGPPEDRPGASGQGIMHHFAALKLSAQQRTQIEGLVSAFHQAHPPGSPPDTQARATLHQQIDALLTPAQQQQLKTMQQHHDQDNEAPPSI